MLATILSIFIGNFLIGLLFKPALDELKVIRDELGSVHFPSDDPLIELFGERRLGADEFQRLAHAARHTLNDVFRRYRLAYRRFWRIGILFLTALLLMVNLTVISLRTNPTNPTAQWSTRSIIVTCIALSSLIILLAIALSEHAYPSPTRLGDLDHLPNHYANIHPDHLIGILNATVVSTIENKNRVVFCLSTAVQITGYKLCVLLTNQDQTKCYGLFAGRIGQRTNVTHIILPSHYRWETKLGHFDLANLRIPNLRLYAHLFIFLPAPRGWRSVPTPPFFVNTQLYEINPDGQLGQVYAPNYAAIGRTDPLVKFERKIRARMIKSWKITEIDTSPSRDYFRVRKILRIYKRELERSKKIRTISRWQSPAVPV